MAAANWIVIPNWHGGKEGFQHYKDRDPKWIKNYTRLLSSDTYLGLSGHRRGIIHGLWLAYASSNCQLRVDTASLSRRLSLRVTMSDLVSLSDAGFLGFSASKPLANRDGNASPEVETETEAEKKKEQEPKAFNEVRNERPAESLSGEEPGPLASVAEQVLAQARLGLVA